MVVIQDLISSVSMAEPLPLVTPCLVLAPTPDLKHSPPSSSRGGFCGHHLPQRHLAAVTLIKIFTPHQGQHKKTDGFTSHNNGKMKLWQPLCSRSRSTGLWVRGARQNHTARHKQCYFSLQEETSDFLAYVQVPWKVPAETYEHCLVAGNACERGTSTGREAGGCPLSTQVRVTSGTYVGHCFLPRPAWHPEPTGQELDKHQQQLFISCWKQGQLVSASH